MADSLPRDYAENLNAAMAALKEQFPVTYGNRELTLEKLSVDKLRDPRDTRSQKEARVRGAKWGVGVKGILTLKDSGKVVDRQMIRLANVPVPTARWSYISNNSEYYPITQNRLKPGIYIHKKQTGVTAAFFNLSKGRNFEASYDPERQLFHMKYGATTLPLYHVMKAIGVSDSDLSDAWGKDVHAKNAAAKPQLAKLLSAAGVDSSEASAPGLVREMFSSMEIGAPEVPEVTIGLKTDRVSGQAMLLSTRKLRNVVRGTDTPDRRDSLEFRWFLGMPEFIEERIRRSGMKQKFQHRMMKHDDVRAILGGSSPFDTSVWDIFGGSGLSDRAAQTNPYAELGSMTRVSVMGEGGISNPEAVTESTRSIYPTFMGVIDPVVTPESEKAGVVYPMSISGSIKNKEPTARVRDVKTGEKENRTVRELFNTPYTTTDEYAQSRKAGRKTRALLRGRVEEVEPSTVKYTIDPASTFSPVTLSSPFSTAISPTRLEMVYRHLTSAIALKDREVPLVMSVTDTGKVVERVLGDQVTVSSPVSGKVASVSKDSVNIRGKDGKLRKVFFPYMYPLNDGRSVDHHEPIVKAGDVVKEGQRLTEANTTRDGLLSMGVNAKVAYMADGFNFEDGITVSESFAKKLTSTALIQKFYSEDATIDERLFGNTIRPMSQEEKDTLDKGVIRPGTIVREGQLLVAGVRKQSLSKEERLLGKKLGMEAFRDASVVWDHQTPGVVKEVEKTPDGYYMSVEVEEVAREGDKLCYSDDHEFLTRNGWVSAYELSADCELASRREDGSIEYVKPTDIHWYSHSGDMYEVRTTQVSFRVTMNHKLLAMPRRSSSFSLVQAKDLAGTRYRLSMSGKWHGARRDTFKFPDVVVKAGRSGNGERTLVGPSWTMDAYLGVLGAYLSDGNLLCIPASGSYGIEITKTKEPNRTKIEEFLKSYGIAYTPTIGGKFRIHSKSLYEYFKQFGLAADKFIPDEVFDLPPDQLKTLYEFLINGDGSRGSSDAYYTVSSRLADGLQRLCLHLGYAASVGVKEVSQKQIIMGREVNCRPLSYRVGIYRSKLCPTVNHGHTKTQNGQFEGVVYYDGLVVCPELPRNHVVYVRREGKAHWSGNSGRHGNKGVIAKIKKDEEMPVTSDGKPMDILMNPIGIGGRMNLSALYETLTGKVAAKDGSPIIVNSFSGGVRIVKVPAHYQTYWEGEGESKEKKRKWIEEYSYERDFSEEVATLLKENGLSDTEDVYVDGKSIGKVLVGSQYFVKLIHQAEHKMASRGAGYPYAYTYEGTPSKGFDVGEGEEGKAQSMDRSMVMSLLAHGATENVREFLTYKGDKDNDAVWTAIQLGEALPPPRVPRVFHKFEAYLNAAGIKLQREDDNMWLMPMTDKEILEQSEGELTKPTLFSGKSGKAKPGELFDEKITGGLDGDGWGHITLPYDIPNPVFVKPISKLLGISMGDVIEVGAGKKGLVQEGGGLKAVEGPGKITLKDALSALDIKAEIASESDPIRKRYLLALDKADLPASTYMLKHVPVVPPKFRPITSMKGRMVVSDLNLLYSDLVTTSNTTKGVKKDTPELMTDKEGQDLRAKLYSDVAALYGLGSQEHYRNAQGIFEQLHGAASVKYGMIHHSIMRRRQDLSGRAVIVPGPHLSLDEVGVPRSMLREMYQPFLIRELSTMGLTPLAAKTLISSRPDDSMVDKALDRVVQNRPIWMKRDPILHKFGVMAFNPVPTNDNVVEFHPLVTSVYNADFDGDDQHGSVIFGVEKGLTLTPTFDNVSLSKQWLEDRQVPARFKVDIPWLDRMDTYMCRLEDFPHGDLLRGAGTREFYSVPSYVKVLSYDDISGGVVWAPVSAWSVHKDCPVVTVELASGRQIFTDDDPRAVYALDPESYRFYRYRPSEAVGKYVPRVDTLEVDDDEVARTIPLLGKGLVPALGLTKAMGWCFGVLAASGCDEEHADCDSIRVVSEDKELLSHWSMLMSELFVEPPVKKVAWNSVMLVSPELSRYVHRWVGHTSDDKKLPPFFMRAPVGFRLGLVEGLVEAIGTKFHPRVRKNTNSPFEFHTDSLRLAQEIQMLLRTLDVRSCIRGSKEEGKDASWRVIVSSLDAGKIGLPLYQAKVGKHPSTDVIPIPSALARQARSALDRKVNVSMYVILSKAIKTLTIGRDSAVSLAALLDGKVNSPYWATFRQLACDHSVSWDKVEGFTETGVADTGYDITVPGYETFMNAEGIVLSNTVGLFVPVSDRAVDEARNAMPSKLLRSPADNSYQYTPTHEALMGLYDMTSIGKKSGKSFSTADAAVAAGKSGEVKMTDVITVGRRKTTLGRDAVANALPEGMRGMLAMDAPQVSKSRMAEIAKGVAENHTGQYGKVMDKLKDLGYEYSYRSGLSLSMADAQVMKKDQRRLVAIMDKSKDKVKAADEIQEAMKKVNFPEDSNMVRFNKAGLKPQRTNLQQIMISPLVGDWGDNNIVPVRKSFAEGLNAMDYWSIAPTARKAIAQKVRQVRLPGDFTKQMLAATMSTVIANKDCGSTGTVRPLTDSADRVLGESAGGLAAGTVLTPKDLQKLRSKGIDRVKVRGPLTCRNGEGLCAKCFGFTEHGPAQIGDNVGITAAQSMGERGAQLSMRGFHSGGFGETPPLDQVSHLLKLPENMPGKATISKITGKVTSVEKTPDGTWVHVSDGKVSDKFFSPVDRNIAVKKGQQIHAGEALTSGVVDPREVLDATKSLPIAQRSLTDSIAGLYKRYGIDPKNVEVLVRAMTNLAVVDDPGTSNKLKGEYVPYYAAQAWNRDNDNSLKITPVIKGITALPQHRDTWMESLTYRGVKTTLTEAAATGEKSKLHGLHPGPSWILGAEFGKPRQNKEPGY